MSQSSNGSLSGAKTEEKLIDAVAHLLTEHGYRVCVNESGVFVAIKSGRDVRQSVVGCHSDGLASSELAAKGSDVDAASHLPRNGAQLVNHQSNKTDRLVVNQASRTCALDETDIELTTAEFDLLSFLIQNAGIVVSRNQLFQHLLGIKYDAKDRTIDLRIARLRRKLGDDPRRPQLIKTVRGAGYILAAN